MQKMEYVYILFKFLTAKLTAALTEYLTICSIKSDLGAPKTT